MKKFCLSLLVTCIFFKMAYSQCPSNDLVYPENSIQEGYYKTSGKIESAGTINNYAHYKASERVQLKSGFSTNSNSTFRADNNCCELNFTDLTNVVIRTNDLKAYIPDNYAYIPTTSIGSSFIMKREDFKINFSGNYASLNVPNTLPALTAPLPLTYSDNVRVYDQQHIIYSSGENDQINGILYFFQKFGGAVNPHTGADIEAVYFHKYGNEYIQTLGIRYPLAEQNEVFSILETVHKWPLIHQATISWSSIASDGCGYEFTINGQANKAINEGIIDPVLHSQLPKDVLLTYYFLPNDTLAYCYETELQFGRLFILGIDELPANNTSCNNIYFDAPFTAAENETYCFPDGKSIIINEIKNYFCECITCNLPCDCHSEGFIQVETTILDEQGNQIEFTYYNGNYIIHPTFNWGIQLLEYSGDGCGEIDEVLLNLTQI